MDTLWGILSFRDFVTPSLLFIAYYAGALGIPLLVLLLVRFARQRAPQLFAVAGQVAEAGDALVARWKLALFFAVIFLCMELAWRVMFEFVIAYFQMHAALMTLSHGQ